MREFHGKVAVVTGGASGIGRGIAERCMEEGMKVVLADIEEAALHETERALSAGTEVLAVRTDVSQASDVAALAQQTLDRFGAVHLLFNNAGVAAGSTVWASTLADWEWVLGVNLWGVIHGVRTFVPIMLEQGGDAHIVNTASMAGLVSTPGLGVYNASKFGVVTLSETLHRELAARKANVKVSVLCPGWVNTRIVDSHRNRPAELQNPSEMIEATAEETRQREAMRQLIREGLSPEQVADMVFDAIVNEKFYILTHPDWKPLIRHRMDDILLGRNP